MEKKEEKIKRAYSAMRPTGELHIGHYFGAIKNWLKLQEEHESFFAVADWHALTTNYDNPENIKEMRRKMVLTWLALGLDINKSTIFIQSHNLYTAELYLLLGMVTPVPWLERCPSYKDMISSLSHKDLSNYGFLGYPVLMTADIIMYYANLVPVGVDQVPHVELAREIVRRFNNFYGECFVEPEAKLTDTPKLLGLDGKKMSKSLNNTISLIEAEESLDKKVRTMVTDTNRVRKSDPGDPSLCPVFDYHKVFSSEDERSEITCACRGATMGCIDCKKVLIKNMNEFISPIRESYSKLDSDISDIDEYLADSQKKANDLALSTMQKVRQAIKL